MTMGAVHEPPLLQRHRLTADEYQRLGRAQVLAPDARVELIDGEVIDMAPIGTRHWAVVSRLQRLLHDAVGHRAVIATQLSLRLGTHSEPQPDLALFKPRDDFYIGALPQADDAILLI
jgi:Uma2 family endonuclease